MPESFRVGTGIAGAMVLGSVGGLAVGYDQWKKEEGARLAAEEVNQDISRMELFRPSDPELAAENKRLRAMLSDTKIQGGSVEPQGRVHENSHHHAV